MAVYVKDSIKASRRLDLEPPTVECIWLEINLNGTNILFGTFSRPPNSPVVVWDHIEHPIDLAFNSNIPNIVITGDLNCNALVINFQSSHLNRILMNFNLDLNISDPTYYNETSSSLLDIIFSNNDSIPEKCYCWRKLSNLSKPRKTSFQRPIWLFDREDYEKFLSRLSQVD